MGFFERPARASGYTSQNVSPPAELLIHLQKRGLLRMVEGSEFKSTKIVSPLLEARVDSY